LVSDSDLPELFPPPFLTISSKQLRKLEQVLDCLALGECTATGTACKSPFANFCETPFRAVHRGAALLLWQSAGLRCIGLWGWEEDVLKAFEEGSGEGAVAAEIQRMVARTAQPAQPAAGSPRNPRV
jgi:hypothetical protein